MEESGSLPPQKAGASRDQLNPPSIEPLQQQPHPLLIDTIVNHLFQFLEPTFLLPCRLVCRTWEQLASSRLGRAGWCVLAGSPRDPMEMYYLPLVQQTVASATEERQEFLRTARMQLRLHRSLTPNSTGVNQIKYALELVTNRAAPFVGSLQLELAGTPQIWECAYEPDFESIFSLGASIPRFESNFGQLLRSVAPALEELKIKFRIKETMDLCGRDVGAADRDKVQAAFTRKETRLPPSSLIALRSLHLSCENGLDRSLLIPVLRVLAQAASRLENLAVYEENIRMVGRAEGDTTPSLAFIEEIQQPQLARTLSLAAHLRSLDIFIGAVDLAARFSLTDDNSDQNTNNTRIQFPVLCELRIRCYQFGFFMTPTRLVQFVAQSCPLLESLDIHDVSRQKEAANLQAVASFELPTALKLTHFGHTHQVSTDNTRSPYAEAVLASMRRCPNLTRVDTNYTALKPIIALFEILQPPHGERLVVPDLFQTQWSCVKTFGFTLAEMDTNRPPGCRHLEEHCFVVKQMFPNLDRLLLRMSLKPQTRHLEFVYALALAFELPNISTDFADDVDLHSMAVPAHVEIEHLDRELTRTISEMAQGGHWPWPDDALNPLRRRDITTGLRSLTLRGVPRSLFRKDVGIGMDTYLRQGRLDLTAIVSLMPRNCPHLVLRIDPELLLPKLCPPDYVPFEPFGPFTTFAEWQASVAVASVRSRQETPSQPSYEQLLHEFQSMNNPRVEFL